MIRVALVGAGTVGQMHLAHLVRQPDTQVVGVCDLRQGLGMKVASRYDIPYYQSHKEMLQKNKPDAAVVVTHRHHTASVAEDLLNAGIHTFTEKPLAMTADQGRALVELSHRNNLRLAVGYQRRFDVGVINAKSIFDKAMRTNEFGPLHLARFWNFQGKDRYENEEFIMTEEKKPNGLEPRATAPNWLPENFKSSYDRFVNVVSHDVNLMNLFFTGEKVHCFSDLTNPMAQVTVLKMGDLRITLTNGFHELKKWEERGPWYEGFEFIFEKGRILCHIGGPLMHDLSADVHVTTPTETLKFSENVKTSPFETEVLDFLSAVRERRQPNVPGEIALKDLTDIEYIWRKGLSL